MFLAAKNAGASAVKLQKRDNQNIFTKELFTANYENENSFGKTYGEHRLALEFDKFEYQELIDYSKEIGITFFSTAFDLRSFDFLEELQMPFYKIASSDITHLPLLREIAKTGKPIILSTGGASMDDVTRAVDAILLDNSNLVLLQCTAAYPPAHNELNLRVISTFKELYQKLVIGLSSHDNGIAMDLVAYILGARVIEKHFTLNRANKGTDNAFSLEPQGFQKLTRDLKRAYVALGDGKKVVYDSELKPINKMRKKMVYSRSLPAGHVICKDDIEYKSPADGLAPYEFEAFIGKTLCTDVNEEQNLDYKQI
jgi:N-acetylneuraminate synthase/sialic acid synthase